MIETFLQKPPYKLCFILCVSNCCPTVGRGPGDPPCSAFIYRLASTARAVPGKPTTFTSLSRFLPLNAQFTLSPSCVFRAYYPTGCAGRAFDRLCTHVIFSVEPGDTENGLLQGSEGFQIQLKARQKMGKIAVPLLFSADLSSRDRAGGHEIYLYRSS